MEFFDERGLVDVPFFAESAGVVDFGPDEAVVAWAVEVPAVEGVHDGGGLVGG